MAENEPTFAEQIQELNEAMLDPDVSPSKRRAYAEEAIHLNSQRIIARQLATEPKARRIL